MAQELEPVSVEGKARWLLSADRDALAHPCGPQERLLLLGPHDPYLDTRDRDVLLDVYKRQSPARTSTIPSMAIWLCFRRKRHAKREPYARCRRYKNAASGRFIQKSSRMEAASAAPRGSFFIAPQ